jgi:hypothetical protein
MKITFNTQGSSQWDSLRHFAYQKDKKFYNGYANPLGRKTEPAKPSPLLTMPPAPRKSKSTPQHALTTTTSNHGQPATSPAAASSSTTPPTRRARASPSRPSTSIPSPSRTSRPSPSSRASSSGSGTCSSSGRATSLRTRLPTRSVASWRLRAGGLGSGRGGRRRSGSGRSSLLLWRLIVRALRRFVSCTLQPGINRPLLYCKSHVSHQASVANQCIAPVDHDWFLHPIILSGWGTPIGELFDLEALAELCKKNKQWSFFFTSSPLNYAGAVASPPNATAIL